jgi:SAM-dependent methyltransferase
MSILRRLFRPQRTTSGPSPTFKEMLIAQAPPWDLVPHTFVRLVIEVLDGTGLLDAFIFHSTHQGLVPKYANICAVDFSAPVIRAQISHILCVTANQALPELAKTTAKGRQDHIVKVLMLCGDCFETAIAFDRNQVGGYIGLAHAYATIGNRDKTREWAKLGLSLLAELREDAGSKAIARGASSIFPPDIDDQMERHLRTYLEF